MKSLSSKLKWKNIFAVQLWAFLFILIDSDTYNFLDFLHICPKDKCHSTAYTIIFVSCWLVVPVIIWNLNTTVLYLFVVHNSCYIEYLYRKTQ